MEEASKHQSQRGDWLINIMMDGTEERSSQSHMNPRIQKVAPRLRDVEAYKKCFDPALASIGPYHHGRPEFQLMEKLKTISARQFVSACNVRPEVVYSKVFEAIVQARECYSEGSTSAFDDEAFTRIMFLDGCFILQFIYCITTDQQCELTTCCYSAAFLLRDLFLLENQLPFLILQALMRVRFIKDEGENMVNKFINQRISPPGRCSLGMHTGSKDRQPLHLLDLLRTRLLSSMSSPLRRTSDTDWHSFRSVKGLKQWESTLRGAPQTLLLTSTSSLTRSTGSFHFLQ
ncbi:hypothetical protein IFM89_028759 [Coptis chinensis]|uniref:Uncharacterized protein n=1 Tax=Coptis chinensis TaxID=261450 RepID=A0A835LFD8_9MAGN|nr:hypothetical protein IFM89_028759 [Coptis chinensis]